MQKYVFRWREYVPDTAPLEVRRFAREISDPTGLEHVRRWIALHEESFVHGDAKWRLAMQPNRELYRIDGEGVQKYLLFEAFDDNRFNFKRDFEEAGLGTIPPADLLEFRSIFLEHGTPSDWEPP